MYKRNEYKGSDIHKGGIYVSNLFTVTQNIVGFKDMDKRLGLSLGLATDPLQV